MFTALRKLIAFVVGSVGKLLVLGFFGALIGSGMDFYTWLTVRQQTSTSLSQFLKTKSETPWVKLSGAVMQLDEIVVQKIAGNIVQAYIPLMPEGEPVPGGTQVLLVTKQQEYLDLAKGAMESEGDVKKELEVVAQMAKGLRDVKTVEGLVRYGLEDSERDRKELAKLLPRLPANYILINHGDGPSIWETLKMLGLSVGLFVGAGVLGLIADAIRPVRPPD